MLDVSGNNKSNTQHFVMKKLLLFILLSPTLLIAQKLVPRFENDTLYTTSGYNFYKGQTLTFAVGTGKKGKFKSVKIKGRDNRITLTNTYYNKKIIGILYFWNWEWLYSNSCE